MSLQHLNHFEALKQLIQKQGEDRLGIRKKLEEYSLQDIRDFQADLEAECKSSVSEKWFYTYFKNDAGKLPRIDVLNLLCAWIGFRNWDDFVHAHQAPTAKKKEQNKWKRWVSWGIVMAFASGAALAVFQLSKSPVHKLDFVDAYTREAIPYTDLTVFANGAIVDLVEVVWNGGDSILVDGPYYKPRAAVVNEFGGLQTVEVFPDDYALMLNFFSRSTAEDLDKRRNILLEAIDPEARIFQSHPKYEGIEMLNREEFIDRLLLPINSLRNLEVQHIEYVDERIYRLQFIQRDKDETVD